ncbi:MAG TPA: glycosyltransferase [Bacteroidales bacterium]|nr:glycosyltransferase [Bacteroidales bacterium]
MENKKSLLVTLADENYILQAKQLFSSVYWNAGWKGDYMLLSHNVCEENLKWFENKGILIKRCIPLYDKCMGDGNYSSVVLNKFYLFTEEFKRWDHIVFLDADIIVRNSLEAFANTKSISSTRTTSKHFRKFFTLEDSTEIEDLKNEYNLNRSAFNSGAIAFNTNIIQPYTFNELFTLFIKYACISNGDDSILNLYFYKLWHKVPLVYNVRVNYLPPIKIRAVVLHFEKTCRILNYERKPWQKESKYFDEWNRNLEKAEEIDVKKVVEVKPWSGCKAWFYSILIKLKVVGFPVFEKIKRFLIYLYDTFERLLGNIGKVMKKYCPGIYFKLKKTEKK